MAIIKEDNGDARADYDTQYTISLGDVFQGALDPANDADWVRVELISGTIYDITLTGAESARFQLLDSEGNHIIFGGHHASGSKLTFSPAMSGIHYISVYSHNADFTDNQDRIDLTYFELSGIDELVITSDTDGVTIDMSSI